MTTRGCLEGDFKTIAEFLLRAAQIASSLQREHGKCPKEFLNCLQNSRDIAELRNHIETFSSQFALPMRTLIGQRKKEIMDSSLSNKRKKEIMDSSLSNKEKSKMVKKNMSKLIYCKLYISESRNNMALDSIERAVRHDPDAVIVNKFEDRAYNQIRYTLVSFIMNDGLSTAYSPMRQMLSAMAEAAYAAIDLETHSGAHH